MKRYIELFRFPNVWVLVLSAFPARVAYGMVGLAIFFKVSSTQSIAIAGLAIGLNAAAGSFTAGIRGSLMDKYGMKWPLRILVPGYAAMMIALNMSHDRTTMLILAFFMGLSAPPINLSVRPLWRDAVSDDWLRTAYAVDTAVMSAAGVIGPVVATTLALSSHPGSALIASAIFMLTGGGSLAMTKIARGWIPEKQPEKKVAMWRHKPLQLLVIEGCFIGFGWGVFDVAVPAFAKLEGVPHRTAWIFTAMGIANIVGGLLGGLVSKKTTPLGALRKTYFIWFIVSIPIAFTYPDWSMAIGGALLGLVGGAIQVFYWEVMEAVRPQGSPSGMMGWLWTIEGTLMSIGSASGGWISESYSPSLALGITTICIGVGFTILTIGRGRLSAANKLPTVEEDLAAMKDNATTNQ
ncbi:MFS_MefA_like domain containing protein [Candidatus Nanopelagicaceae bacterium]